MSSINVKTSDKDGKSSLMYACEAGYIKVITDLITKYRLFFNKLLTVL